MRIKYRKPRTSCRDFLMIFLILLFTVCFTSINSPTFAQDGRLPEIINSVPKNVPIKIEIITPEKVEDFPEKIRIKVTNTGEKSIYSLRMFLEIDDEEKKVVAPDGKMASTSFDLIFGRKQLSRSREEMPTEEDTPIKPNESYTLKISKYYAGVVKKNFLKRGLQLPRVYRLIFWNLSYGDGTGFNRNGDDTSKKN